MDASPASSDLRTFVSFGFAHTKPRQSPSLRILIVDNDERSAADVRRQLSSHRADSDDSVKCTRHGLDALVVAEEFQPQLVIMQLGLPRRSGSCTAKLLRARPWAERVVIVSQSLEDDATEVCSADFDFHFYGAIDIPLLFQMHHNLLLRRSHTRRTRTTSESLTS